MAITQATSLADFSTGIGTAGAVLQVDNVDGQVGIGTTDPQGTLQVGIAITMDGTAGVITASSFSGSGANLTFTGADISAATGTFTGNVSVGGTLTYEDVTNIDAVGVITARSDVSIADKIIHTGDTNTAIRFPAADTFTVETGGTERVRVDSSGRLLVGTDTTITDTNFGIGKLQATNKDGYQHVLFSGHSASAANATTLSVGRSRGSQSSPGYLSSGDHIARLSAISYNGGNYQSSGCIDFYAADQHASNDLPGYIVFNTVPDGSATLTERLRITAAGDFGYGTSSPGCFFEVSKDDSGATVQQKLLNRSTDANSSSNNFIYVNGAAAGDPFTTWTVGGVTSWSMGIDNSDSDKLVINNGSNLSSNLVSIDTSGNVTLTANLDLQDNDKILLGTGDDLQIYHSGSHSFIADASGTGNLYINSSKLVITDSGDTETMANFIENGAVELFHNGVKKLETSSAGVTVTGTLNASTDVTIDGKSAATTGKSIAMAMVFG